MPSRRSHWRHAEKSYFQQLALADPEQEIGHSHTFRFTYALPLQPHSRNSTANPSSLDQKASDGKYTSGCLAVPECSKQDEEIGYNAFAATQL